MVTIVINIISINGGNSDSPFHLIYIEKVIYSLDVFLLFSDTTGVPKT